MGLSIHYSGSFNPSASLQGMIDEVTDIAEIFKWTYHVYETEFPQPLSGNDYDGKIYGIGFTPPESETISLCFLSNGKMSCLARLRYFGRIRNPMMNPCCMFFRLKHNLPEYGYIY